MSITKKSLLRVGTGHKEHYHDITDPHYVGPGIWFVIHSMACKATTYDQQRNYVQFIYDLQSKFPCETCKGHFGQYLEKNPPENYLGLDVVDEHKTKHPYGMAVWSWKFHNTVNERTNKPIMKWSTFEELYMSEDATPFCTSSCEYAL